MFIIYFISFNAERALAGALFACTCPQLLFLLSKRGGIFGYLRQNAYFFSLTAINQILHQTEVTAMAKNQNKAKKSRKQVAEKKINASSMRLQDKENMKMSLKDEAAD